MFRYELIKAAEEFLKEKFEHATEFEQPDIAYRIEHTYRVANIGREIAVKEGFDETEMVIACLLHDVSYSCRERLKKNHQRISILLSA